MFNQRKYKTYFPVSQDISKRLTDITKNYLPLSL